jgi:ribosomal protein L7Ae-like RNA K-turn-binding protein
MYILLGTKAERVKLLLIAPDTEISGTIDQKLDILLDLAVEKDIPIIYCLNRKKLGKAIKSSMKQVILNVFVCMYSNIDGYICIYVYMYA